MHGGDFGQRLQGVVIRRPNTRMSFIVLKIKPSKKAAPAWPGKRRARQIKAASGPGTLPAVLRQALIAAAPMWPRGACRDLPGDITLKPGELRIEFFGAEGRNGRARMLIVWKLDRLDRSLHDRFHL
jgi:hypothetical protein